MIDIMYKLVVDNIKKEYFQAQNENVLVANCSINLEDKEIEKRSFSFPLDTSEEELKEELKKFIANYNLEAELAQKNKALDEANVEADKTIASVAGLEF